MSVIELPSIPVIHNTTVCASMDFVSKNEEVVTAYLKALIEAIHFFKTQGQRVCEILNRDLAPLIHLEGTMKWSIFIERGPGFSVASLIRTRWPYGMFTTWMSAIIPN